MSSLTISDLADDLTLELVRRAERHGRSPEAEATAILADTLADEAERRSVRRGRDQIEKLARAQAILRGRIPAGTPLVDEFLAGRRALWGEA